MRNNGSKRRVRAPCAAAFRCLLGVTIALVIALASAGVASSSTGTRRPVYVVTVTTKSTLDLPAWYAIAQHTASKACARGNGHRYRAARVTVRHGVVFLRNNFACVGGRAVHR